MAVKVTGSPSVIVRADEEIVVVVVLTPPCPLDLRAPKDAFAETPLRTNRAQKMDTQKPRDEEKRRILGSPANSDLGGR